jgi:hypothetical protein
LTGIVRGYEVKKNRDSGQKVLMLQVEISGPDDVQSVEYMSHAGDDHIPPLDTTVTILDNGGAWKIAIASNDMRDFDTSLSEGDRKLYSKNAASFIKILSDGTIEINGNADFAVSWTDLNTALQLLVGSINTAFAAKLDGGGSSPALTLDLSASKIEEVKFP